MKRILSLAIMLTLAGSANAADKVKIGGNKLAAVAPIFIAIDKGYFSAEEIDPALVNLTSAQAIGAAVASGEIQFGMTAFTSGIFTLGGKGALKIIAGGLEEAPGYQSVAVLASRAAYEKGLTKLSDVSGRKVGLTSVGSPNQYQIFQIARKYKFDYRALHLAPLQTYGNLVSALKGDQVDVALLSTTMAIQAERAGSKVLAWMGDEEPMQLGGILVPAKLPETKPDLIVRFLRAYLRGLHYYDEAFQKKDANGKKIKGVNYDEGLKIIGKYTEQKPEAVAAGLPYFDSKARINAGSISDQIDFYKSMDQMDASLSPTEMIDVHSLERLEQKK